MSNLLADPLYVTLEELCGLVTAQDESLPVPERAWFQKYRVSPFVVSADTDSHYAVARFNEKALVFFDDEDEFGFGTLDEQARVRDCGLCGDLIDAIRVLQNHA